MWCMSIGSVRSAINTGLTNKGAASLAVASSIVSNIFVLRGYGPPSLATTSSNKKLSVNPRREKAVATIPALISILK